MLSGFAHMLMAGESDDAIPTGCLFEGPYVSYQRQRLAVPKGSKRLFAFVALRCRGVERGYTAGALWPICGGIRAACNWQWALWCRNHSGIPLLKVGKHGLAMRHDVLIDQHVVSAWANRLIRIAAARGALEMISSGVDTIDLLPGRYDDWVLMEPERTRRRPLHALEAQISIRSGLVDDLDEALSWNGSTGTTQLRGRPPDAVALSCDNPRAAGRPLTVKVEVRK
jgi:hypothetical protein